MALIAREAELASVVERSRAHRLVTIVGPGGVGKTALARAAADVLEPEFEHGVRSVDLTRVDDPDAVPELIAGQLGFADFESLVNSPGDQPALILVDNCEHVLDAAAAAIDEILSTCRMPTVLATSRSPLDVADEVIAPLAPLETPPPEYDAADVGSVQMFAQRVVDFGGEIGDGDEAALAEVCRRLDGVPLALEIAAARSRTRTLAEILAEIADRPAGLSRPRFRGHAAHRSVTDMVGWSLLLLSDEARSAFDALGVIAGPFTEPMAEAVVADVSGGGAGSSAGSLLDELVDASLVIADRTGPTTWYRLLHPVRAVALVRLRDAGRIDEVVDRAVDYVVSLSVDVVVGSSSGWGDQLTTLLGMYDNMIASLKWVNEHDDRPNRSLTLLAVLWGVVHQSHTAEVATVGESVLERWPDRAAPFWPDAAATVATCRNLLGRHDEAIELATAALADVGGSPFAPASLRRVIAQAHRALGHTAESRDWFGEGARIADENGVYGIAMELRVDHALLVAELGDPGAALEEVDGVVAEAERRSAPINLSWALGGRGAILLRAGDDRALAELERAVAYARSIGYPAGVSFSLRMLVGAHLERDDRQAAATALLELLDALLERGGLNDLRMVLDHTAVLLDREGDERWLDVAATAQALPVTTVGAAVTSDVFDRAAGRGTVLPSREVYSLCREALAPIAAGSVPEGSGPPPPIDDSLVLDGDTWRWTYSGRSVTVKASKGMADLARLVERPGREIAALDLMGSPKLGDAAIETVDGRYRRELEERIRELQADIEEADAHHDIARSERSSIEMDRLVDELGAAVGLGRRARATGTDPERARSAVTQRIRAAISRLDGLHPKLGGHLATSVDTGRFCVYRPADDHRWRVER